MINFCVQRFQLVRDVDRLSATSFLCMSSLFVLRVRLLQHSVSSACTCINLGHEKAEQHEGCECFQLFLSAFRTASRVSLAELVAVVSHLAAVLAGRFALARRQHAESRLKGGMVLRLDTLAATSSAITTRAHAFPMFCGMVGGPVWLDILVQ